MFHDENALGKKYSKVGRKYDVVGIGKGNLIEVKKESAKETEK